jgi:putative membrane protein insertion efficiency factor
MIRRILIACVRAYQVLLSPLKLPTCRFYPSCSAYTIDALRRHGAVKGALLGAWRIARCNPFCRGGYDPVPPAGKWRDA